ncbi:MAG: hypothetical protein P8I97_13730, partial [Verrucomicrobiales bacterium]|nr:hypothetical protein [Verrucomicrobiales bacterium]
GLQYSIDLETWVDFQYIAGHPLQGQVVTIQADSEVTRFLLQGATNPFGPQGANLSSVYVRIIKK